MTQEQSELKKEQQEQFEKVQRLELDPDERVDIVIERLSGEEIQDDLDKYFPSRVSLEKDGKIIENFNKRFPELLFYSKNVKRGPADAPWRFDRTTKRIFMPRLWDNSRDILSFLHEVGHGLHFLEKPQDFDRRNELLKREELLRFQLYTIKERGSIWYRKRIGESLEERSVTENDLKKLIKELGRACKEYIPLAAKIERGGWARALKLARKLKQEKEVDLFKPFEGKHFRETRKNLENYIHGPRALGSYEKFLREEINEKGLEIKELEELKGAFTKKYKQEAIKISEEISEKASKL